MGTVTKSAYLSYCFPHKLNNLLDGLRMTVNEARNYAEYYIPLKKRLYFEA